MTATHHPRVARGVLSHPPPPRRPDALGLGVIGLGEGRTAAVAALTRTRNVHTVVGCDLDPALREAIAEELPGMRVTGDMTDVLADDAVDLVAIYTPDHLHGAHICEALDAGKDVVVTKPIVNSAADAQRVLATAARTGRRVFVGQSTRYFRPFVRQREDVAAGRMGTVEVVEAHYTHRMDWYYPTRPWAAADSDWVYMGMSHPLDLLRCHLGPLATVSAVGARSAVATSAGASRDIISAQVVSAEGRIGRAFGHYGAHELPRARNSIECMVYGTEGTSLARYHDMQYLWTDADGVEHLEDHLYELRHFHFNNEVHGMHYGEFANYLDAFAGALLDGDPAAPELDEALEVYALMQAVDRSMDRGGAQVSVPEVLAELRG